MRDVARALMPAVSRLVSTLVRCGTVSKAGVETSNRQRGRCHGVQKVAVRRKWNQQFANDFLESLDAADTSVRATKTAPRMADWP